MQTAPHELRDLAAVLADWTAAAPAATLYLFGSRVRGDYRPDSDVDVSVAWGQIGDADMDWWMQNNQELFVTSTADCRAKFRSWRRTTPSRSKSAKP